MFGHSSDKDGSSSSPNSTASSCPALPSPLDDAAIVVGPFTLHQFLQILAGACGVVAIVVSLILFLQHAVNLRNPREQIKIMRIITIIPVFAGVTYAGLCLGQGAIYLQPWIEVWEAFCICTFFLLVVTYVHADPDTQLTYFDNLPMMRGFKTKKIVGPSSAAFYKRVRIAIFQMVPVLTLLAIVQDASEAAHVFCINSNKPRFAHIWITVLHGISTSVAVASIISLCSRLRSELPDRRLWSQLFAFKTIIGLNFLQTFVFSIVAGQASPTDTLSYNDISVGLPSALIIIEMMFFAIAFHKFYTYKPYRAGGQNALSQKPVMSAWLAIAKALNPLEVLEGMFAAFTGKAGGKRAYAMGGDGDFEMPRAGSRDGMLNKVTRPAETHPMIGVPHHDGMAYHGREDAFETGPYQQQSPIEGPPHYSHA